MTVFDLVEAVVENMKGFNKGKIVMHKCCRKVWELLESDGLKENQLEGNGRLKISRIVELESKYKIKFDHVHAKTTTFEENTSTNKGLAM